MSSSWDVECRDYGKDPLSLALAVLDTYRGNPDEGKFRAELMLQHFDAFKRALEELRTTVIIKTTEDYHLLVLFLREETQSRKSKE